jgi:hypothetical protein
VHKITTVRTIHLQDNNFFWNISRFCAQNYGRKTVGDLSIDGKIITIIWALTFWHRSFTFNSNKSRTWCNSFSVYYPEICLQLNMPAGRPARPRTQHGYYHNKKVKPEAATAVIELLIMGMRTPETCWDVNKRQDNKLKNCCIRFVIYLN